MDWMQRLFLIFVGMMTTVVAAYAQDAVLLTSKFSAVTQPRLAYDQFIVTYRKGSAERQNRTAALQRIQTALNHSIPLTRSGGKASMVKAIYLRKLLVGADLIHTSRALDRKEANAFMLRLAENSTVQYVEPDAIVSLDPPPAPAKTASSKAVSPDATPSDFPNDPDYEEQAWQFGDPPGGIQLTRAWSSKSGADGGKEVVVAVLDNGITQHPDLDTSLANDGYDFISDPLFSGRPPKGHGNGRIPGGWDTGDWSNTEPWLSKCVDSQTGIPFNSPSSWHGTHVAGTIAELTNNGIDGAGIAYNAKILPVRVIGHCGSGRWSDVIDAIVWAAAVPDVDYSAEGLPPNKHPADVINMSLARSRHPCEPEGAMQQAINMAIKQGVVVVVGAGNNDEDAKDITPASCQGVIAVAATDSRGRRADYSNYGKDITLAAPGGGIEDDSTNPPQYSLVWSTSNDGKTIPNKSSFTGNLGTSMATPHVAGVVALMIAARRAAHLPALSPAGVKQILEMAASAWKLPDPDPQKPIGAGVLNAYLSVCMAGFC